MNRRLLENECVEWRHPRGRQEKVEEYGTGEVQFR